MENSIRHDGIIEQVSEGHIRVRIVQTSACAGCKVAAHCHTAEAKDKVVDVMGVADARRWKVGDAVVVSTASSMAGRALLIGFGLPLLLMLAVLVATMAAGCSEGMSALLMIVSLVPYYIIVWLCRHRIARDITFKIEDV